MTAGGGQPGYCPAGYFLSLPVTGQASGEKRRCGIRSCYCTIDRQTMPVIVRVTQLRDNGADHWRSLTTRWRQLIPKPCQEKPVQPPVEPACTSGSDTAANHGRNCHQATANQDLEHQEQKAEHSFAAGNRHSMTRGDKTRAEQLFNDAIDYHPQHRDARIQLAAICCYAGDIRCGRATLERRPFCSQTHAAHWLVCMHSYWQTRGEFDGALRGPVECY